MIKIFVGDVGEYLAEEAKACDASAQLLTADSDPRLKPGVYYTSYGDIQDLALFTTLLRQADELMICPPPDRWSDNVSAMAELTYQIVNMIQSTKGQLQTGVPEHVHDLIGDRVTADPQLWIVGDSISHGMGVAPKDRYGELLAKSLKLPVTYLTQVASSIPWASDQILRSDIRSEDIVVWGLTHRQRFVYYTNTSLFNVSAQFEIPVKLTTAEQKMLKQRIILDDNTYQSILAILRVQNFCKKIGSKLILIDMFDDNFQKYLVMDNYSSVSQVDYGFDYGLHPGPLTHQRYSEHVLNIIKIHENLWT